MEFNEINNLKMIILLSRISNISPKDFAKCMVNEDSKNLEYAMELFKEISAKEESNLEIEEKKLEKAIESFAELLKNNK